MQKKNDVQKEKKLKVCIVFSSEVSSSKFPDAFEQHFRALLNRTSGQFQPTLEQLWKTLFVLFWNNSVGFSQTFLRLYSNFSSTFLEQLSNSSA